jgi:apolipoprotein N-acyltransferase
VARASDVAVPEVILVADVAIGDTTTVYAAAGDWVLGVAVVVLVAAWARGRRALPARV